MPNYVKGYFLKGQRFSINYQSKYDNEKSDFMPFFLNVIFGFLLIECIADEVRTIKKLSK